MNTNTYEKYVTQKVQILLLITTLLIRSVVIVAKTQGSLSHRTYDRVKTFGVLYNAVAAEVAL